MSRLGKSTAFEGRMLAATAAYLKSLGWSVFVISGNRIQGPVDRCFNYEIVIRFTGRHPSEKLTNSQAHVLAFLRSREGGWFRPSEIQPAGYEGGASSVGRVLSSLAALRLVTVRQADRGNGTSCKEYSAAKGGGQ